MAEKKLHVTCDCGQTLAFRADQAGGRFRCPACKEPLDLSAAVDEEGEAPPRRAAAPRGSAPAKKPGSGFSAQPPAGSGRRDRRPAPQEDAEEEIAPSRTPSRSGAQPKGRGGPAAPAAPISPEVARKKKLMLIGGGGGVLVLVIVVAGIMALRGPGKPENAGKTSEGKEVWKVIETDFKVAENKDDTAARNAAFKKVLESIEGTRKLHDYGWPDYFKGRALARMGSFADAKASFEAAIGKLDKASQNYPKIERGLIAARQSLESLLRTRRFRAGGVSLASDPAADALGKEALPDLKLADTTKEADFFSSGLLALAQAEADRIESRPSGALTKYETAIAGRAQTGYAQAASGGLYYELDKFPLGVKTMEAALESDHGSGFARLSAAWGLRRWALADPGNTEAAGWIARAIEFADKAATDGHPAAPAAAACLRLDKAVLLLDKGQDGKAALDEADAKVTEALGKDSNDPTAQEIQAVILYRRAELEERNGKDPRPLLDSAITALDRLASDSKNIPALMNRGKTLLKRARAEAVKGADPRNYYERATKDFDAARGNDGPGSGTIEPILGGATARVEKAMEDSKQGTDASPVFQKVIDEMTGIIKSRPNQIAALEARGLARWALSEALTKQGKDGAQPLEDALNDLDELFRQKPSLRVGEILVDAWIAKGEAQIKAGIDPRGPFDNASRNIEELLKISPGNLGLQLRRGRAMIHSAEHALKQNMDPRSQLATAIADFSAILAAQPDNLDALLERGRAQFMMGRAETGKGQDARVSLNSAIKDLELLLTKDPKNAAGAFQCADAILFLGQFDFERNNDAMDTFSRAAGKFDLAVKLDDKNGETWNGLGRGWLLVAEASRKAKKETSLALESAETALRKAIELGFMKAWGNLAMVLGYQKKWDEAEKAIDTAEEKVPEKNKEAAELRKWLKDLKKRMDAGE